MTLQRTISIVVIMILAGCAEGRLTFPFDEDAPLPPVSVKERCEAQRQLAGFKVGEPPSSMVGGVLFDGTTDDVRAKTDGKQVVSLRVEQKLLGADLVSSDRVTLITPRAEAGGVAFQTGRRYRVFAVPLRGNFYTWAATGSFDLDRPVDCPK
jgi:hypothetical protein